MAGVETQAESLVIPVPAAAQPVLEAAIRHCLSAVPGAPPTQAVRECFSAPAFDWEAFLAVVSANRLGPLVHERARAWDLFPARARAVLQEAALRSAWDASWQLDALAEIAGAFRAAGLPLVLLKGAALLLTTYAKPALRPMADLDLLVRPRDLPRAREILLEMGYSVLYPVRYPDLFQHELDFLREKPFRVGLDLHTNLFPMPHAMDGAQMEWFWRNTVAAQKGSVAGLVFRPEAQLLHLCGHTWLGHHGGDLVNQLDAHEVIRQNSLDWDLLLEKARAFGLLIPLQRTLPGLAAGWGTPVPAGVLARLAALRPTRRELRRFRNKPWERFSAVQAMLAGVAGAPDPLTALRYAWYMLFPYPQYMMSAYGLAHPRQLPLAYLRRMADLLFRARI